MYEATPKHSGQICGLFRIPRDFSAAELARILMEKEVIFAEDVEKIFGKRPWASRSEEIFADNKTADENITEETQPAETAENKENISEETATA